jgi:hypothetical protein
MHTTMKTEIDAITAERRAAEAERPGRFWGDCGRTLSHAEAEVFGIAYEDFLRMVTVWEAWLDFCGLTMDGPVFHSEEAIAEGRKRHPALTDAHDLGQFTEFGTRVGGLTIRQAEAMFWKDWFWLVRQGHAAYPDDTDTTKANAEANRSHH